MSNEIARVTTEAELTRHREAGRIAAKERRIDLVAPITIEQVSEDHPYPGVWLVKDATGRTLAWHTKDLAEAWAEGYASAAPDSPVGRLRDLVDGVGGDTPMDRIGTLIVRMFAAASLRPDEAKRVCCLALDHGTGQPGAHHVLWTDPIGLSTMVGADGVTTTVNHKLGRVEPDPDGMN